MHYVNLSERAKLRGLRWLAAACLVLVASCDSCHEKAPKLSGQPPSTGAVLPDDFERVYAAILVRNRTDQERATDWNGRYSGNWVRWVGKVMSVTDHSITIKQRSDTSTFDVSLGLDNEHLAQARQNLQRGSIIQYMGKLDSYDDIWRTFYLVQGVILEPPALLDLGLGK